MTTDDPVPFTVLAAVTDLLLEQLDRPPVRVSRLRRPGLDGETDGRRFIRYADRAPLITVAHEVAHLTTRRDHDAVWLAEVRRLAPMVAAIATGLAGRGLASPA